MTALREVVPVAKFGITMDKEKVRIAPRTAPSSPTNLLANLHIAEWHAAIGDLGYSCHLRNLPENPCPRKLSMLFSRSHLTILLFDSSRHDVKRSLKYNTIFKAFI